MTLEWDEESFDSYFQSRVNANTNKMYGDASAVLDRLSQALENLCKYGFGAKSDEGLSESD